MDHAGIWSCPSHAFSSFYSQERRPALKVLLDNQRTSGASRQSMAARSRKLAQHINGIATRGAYLNSKGSFRSPCTTVSGPAKRHGATQPLQKPGMYLTGFLTNSLSTNSTFLHLNRKSTLVPTSISPSSGSPSPLCSAASSSSSPTPLRLSSATLNAAFVATITLDSSGLQLKHYSYSVLQTKRLVSGHGMVAAMPYLLRIALLSVSQSSTCLIRVIRG